MPTVTVFDSQGKRSVFQAGKLASVISRELEGNKDQHPLVNIPGISVPLVRYEARRLLAFLYGDPPFENCEIVIVLPDKAFLYLDGELMH